MTVLVTILPNLRRVKSILGLRVILATKIALEKKNNNKFILCVAGNQIVDRDEAAKRRKNNK